MQKPQVNINLNIQIPMNDPSSPDWLQGQINDAIARAHLIQEQLGINAIQGECSKAEATHFVPASRHHQSVAANTRIMDAIEFINKEMRLLKGHSENGTLKVFEELKGILLGI
jgi:hypothetical protein